MVQFLFLGIENKLLVIVLQSSQNLL